MKNKNKSKKFDKEGDNYVVSKYHLTNINYKSNEE